MSIPVHLRASLRVREEMIGQAVAELPNECCGWLAGHLHEGISVVVKRYPLVNAEASPIRYYADADSLMAAQKDMRRLGLDIVAVYHSHPTSDPVPSQTDLRIHAESLYAETQIYHLIISLKTSIPTIRGWWLKGQEYEEIELEWMEEEKRS